MTGVQTCALPILSFAKISSVYTTKYFYLVNLSIIINIISYSCPMIGSFNFSNLTIKSYNIIIDSCLMSNAVPIKVHTDYCRDIDTKNLQGEHEW